MARRPADWLRTSDAPVARQVRALRRLAARADARRRHGSVPAAMDATVASVGRLPRREVVRRTAPPRRVVALSTYPLHPGSAGGQLRGLHLAGALAAEADVEVDVLSTTVDRELAGERRLGPHLRETTVAYTPEHLARDTALRLPSGPVSITDISVALMWAGLPQLVARLDDLLADATAVVLVQPYLVPAVQCRGAGLPIVADEHNDEWELKAGILPRNDGGRWLLQRVDEIERAAVEHAALVTATTDADLRTLERRYRLPEHRAVVPNGVDTTQIEFVTGGDRARRKVAVAQELGLDVNRPVALFVGSGHGPNIDAGRRIAALAPTLPDVQFVLAGRHSAALGLRRVAGNVRTLGVVPEDLLDLLLAGCDVALNPMEGGSGSNLKLLTYLAAGIPVVSTVVGARGIDAGVAGVYTCELDELGDGIAVLLAETAPERSEAGRDYVVRHCDWSAIGARFVGLCRATVLA